MQWSISTDLSEESIIFSCIIHSEENGVRRERRRPAFLIWRESRVTVRFTSGRLSGLLLASDPCSTCAHCTFTCSYLLCSCSAMRRSAKRSLLQFWWGSKLSSFTVTLLLPHIKLQGEEEYLRHAFCRFISPPPFTLWLQDYFPRILWFQNALVLVSYHSEQCIILIIQAIAYTFSNW